MSAKKHRLTLEFDAKVMKRMELVQERTSLTSKTALIQRAIALFDLYTEHEAAGGEVFFKDKDGKPERVRVLT